MRFYVLLALVNVACFLPLYVINARVAPNPFPFLIDADRTKRMWLLRLMHYRHRSTDPFRIHFDFTFYVLVAAAAGATGPLARLGATVLLALGFVEILYTIVMYSVFKRPPALASDVSLLRAGLSLAQRQAYWMVPVAFGLVMAIFWGASVATSALFALAPLDPWPAVAVAAMLLPPCLYHFSRRYDRYMWRTVYSPLLHLALNLRVSALLKRMFHRDAAHFERYNVYGRIRLAGAPNVVILCVESYGSVVYQDARAGAGVPELLDRHERRLIERGYRFASTFSEAPLFAGGSWLSYASFLYGTRIDDIQLYDGLFAHPGGFAAYESLLHVLRRNGYENVLLCPLGGVDRHAVDWQSLDRCFQAQHRIGFEDLRYVGPRVNYLGVVRRFSPLDQFSLNHGYESARSRSRRFSLFFCTLNSHYPWLSASEASNDWRALNAPETAAAKESRRPLLERYNAAIRYQLDYILRFVTERADEAPLVIVFGDHQPPFVTPERVGKETPVHVMSRDQRLVDAFLAHGFAGTLNLAGIDPQRIRHEGFLSLLMKGLQSAYGLDPDLEVTYREHGSEMFDEVRADRLGAH